MNSTFQIVENSVMGNIALIASSYCEITSSYTDTLLTKCLPCFPSLTAAAVSLVAALLATNEDYFNIG